MSKGGSTTSSTQIPEWAENAAIENINKAREVSEIGYVPYYGPEVAAFSPMQEQSMKTTGGAASAFGMVPKDFDATAGIPAAESYAGGIKGYSSMPLYREALSALETARPAQYKALTNMFIDPFTGAAASGDYTKTVDQTDQMIDRNPVDVPDYSINIDNSATGGTGLGGESTATGTGTGGASEAMYDSIYGSTSYTDLTGGDTFVGNDGETYEVGYGEGQVDHGLANAAVDANNDQAVYDSIYGQAEYTDLTGGDTFIGDDGNTYTVGGGEGQVDAGLANSVVDFGTTPYDTGSVTEDSNYLTDYSLEGGLPPANSGNSDYTALAGDYGTDYSDSSIYDFSDPAAYGSDAVSVSASGVVDPLTTNGQALGNIAEAGIQGVVNNGLLGMGVKAVTGNEIIEGSGSKNAPVSDLSNADARPMTGLLSPAFDNLEDARDNIMSLISSNGFDAKYDTDGDGEISITDMLNAVKLGIERGTPIAETNKKGFGNNGSVATVAPSGATTYNQAYWANQRAMGVSQADMKKAQDALQDPNTPWNDAYSDVAINGTDWFKNLFKPKTVVANTGGGGGNNVWTPPVNNGYAGQSGNKSSQGTAKTGYGFGL